MNKSFISQTIIKAISKMESVTAKLSAAKDAFIQSDIERFHDKIMDSIYTLERQALGLRGIVNSSSQCFSPAAYKQMMETLATDVYQIAIDVEDDVTHVRLPCLLPHSREYTQCPMEKPLLTALKKYQSENAFPFYKKVVVVFANTIDRDIKMSHVRDNDSYEYKTILNTITFFLLPDDGFAFCDYHATTLFGKENKTDIYIVPEPQFADWYAKRFPEKPTR